VSLKSLYARSFSLGVASEWVRAGAKALGCILSE
jgi:hypothetical protein